MLNSLTGSSLLPAITVDPPLKRSLARAGGLLAAAALAAVLLISPQQSQVAVPAVPGVPHSGAAQLVQTVADGATFVVTKGQKG